MSKRIKEMVELIATIKPFARRSLFYTNRRVNEVINKIIQRNASREQSPENVKRGRFMNRAP